MGSTAWGRGLVTRDANGVVLDAWYPKLGLGEQPDSATDEQHRAAVRHDDVRCVDIALVAVEVDLDQPERLLRHLNDDPLPFPDPPLEGNGRWQRFDRFGAVGEREGPVALSVQGVVRAGGVFSAP